jgi:CRP/FNR family transcriptional regulator
MYIETASSPTRNAALVPVRRADQALTLKDLFKWQATEKLYRRKSIFWEGDQANQIIEVVEGVVRSYRTLSDGRRAIIGFLYPGDLLGVSFQNRHLFTAEAVTNTVVRRFPLGRFNSLVHQSPALRLQLLALLCDEISAAQNQILLLGRRSAEERVVSFLLEVRRRSAAEADIELPMSRLDIADYLGLTMETVSRMMTSLCRRGLIASCGDHNVSLCNIGVLRGILGDNRHRRTLKG